MIQIILAVILFLILLAKGIFWYIDYTERDESSDCW